MRLTSFLLAGIMALTLGAPAFADHARYSAVLTIDPESAKMLMDRGEPLLPIDVRPTADFRAARLPGARSVPLDTLLARLDEVPRGTDVVLYGNGDAALVAYQVLRAERFTRLYVLEGGLSAWQRLGYRIER